MTEIDINKLYITAFFDPKGANPNTKGTSRAAIVTVGMDDLERVFILQSWASFAGADDMLARVFKFNEKWKPAVFGVDITGTQAIWLNMIRKEAELKNYEVPRLRGVNFAQSKRQVIETVLQPLSARGKLFRPPEPEVKELKSEWQNFPSGNHRDALDALTHAIMLLPIRPPQEAHAMEMQSYRRHLIRSGLSQEEISRKMNEVQSR